MKVEVVAVDSFSQMVAVLSVFWFALGLVGL